MKRRRTWSPSPGPEIRRRTVGVRAHVQLELYLDCGHRVLLPAAEAVNVRGPLVVLPDGWPDRSRCPTCERELSEQAKRDHDRAMAALGLRDPVTKSPDDT